MECLQGFVSLWLSCSSTSKGPAKDWNSQTFCFCKFQKSSFFEVRNFLEITGFFKLVKFFWKKFGNNFLFLGQKTLWFPKIPNLPKFWNLFYSKLSKNYEKMMTNSNFKNCKKLIPARKPTQMFSLKLGMQGLSTSELW